jgi:hypothetical protein
LLALFYDWRSLVHQAALGLGDPRPRRARGEALEHWQLAKTLAIRESFWVMTAMFAVTLIRPGSRVKRGHGGSRRPQPADA